MNLPAEERIVVQIWKKYDGRLTRELHFHKLLELKKGEPIGVSLHIQDGKRDVWTDPSQFVPLNDKTKSIIEEIQALEEQQAGLGSEITSLYKKLEAFFIAPPWH